MFSLSTNKDTDIELPTSEDIQHYQKLRETALGLQQPLLQKLPKSAIEDCAKKLGLLKGKALMVGSEDELSVLFDYCFFHYRINQVNLISRYLMMSPPEPDSLEMEFLTASAQAHYAVLIVKKVFKNQGVLVLDVLNNQEIFVLDLNLSKTAAPGFILASNIIPIGKFYRSSGAILPLPVDLFENEIVPIIEKFLKKTNVLSSAQEALFAAQVIRTALRANVMENMGYK